MYQPPHHREDDLGVQQALIRAHPLGLLVTGGAGGPQANLIPFVLDATAGRLGTLRGHLARPNPQWRDADPDAEALVVFQGPQAYVSPAWYATKAETGKVVPTWNYATVQVRGRLQVRDDRDWLRAQVEALTGGQEAARAEPWAVGDAPAPYIEALIRGIVGIEIEIARIEGKWKVSQNRPEADRAGVVAGLGDHPMAGLVAAADRKDRA